jgi:hypothetical protein
MTGFLMATALFVVSGIMLPLLLAEFFECSPWMADRILKAAARRVPSTMRAEQRRHWEGDIDTIPGKLSKIVVALHILLKSGATGRAMEEALTLAPLGGRADDLSKEVSEGVRGSATDWRRVYEELKTPLWYAAARGARRVGVRDRQAIAEAVQQAFTEFMGLDLAKVTSPDSIARTIAYRRGLDRGIAARRRLQSGRGD